MAIIKPAEINPAVLRDQAENALILAAYALPLLDERIDRAAALASVKRAMGPIEAQIYANPATFNLASALDNGMRALVQQDAKANAELAKQAPFNIHSAPASGPEGKDGRYFSAEGRFVNGRWESAGSERAPSLREGMREPGSSSARFTGELPVASNGSNFDLRNITAARFNTDPSMTMFRHANMNLEQTRAMFGDLRKQGFRDPEIHRAAKDVSDLRIGGTPEKMRKNAEHASHLNKKAPEFVPAFKKIDKKEGDAFVQSEIKARHLQHQLDEARRKGDTAAVARLEKEHADARKKADAMRDQTLSKENEAINKHVKPAEQPRAKDWQKDTWERREKDVIDGVKKLRTTPEAEPEKAKTGERAGIQKQKTIAEGQVQRANDKTVAEAVKTTGGDVRAVDKNAEREFFAGLETAPKPTKAAEAAAPPNGKAPSAAVATSTAQSAATTPAQGVPAKPVQNAGKKPGEEAKPVLAQNTKAAKHTLG